MIAARPAAKEVLKVDMSNILKSDPSMPRIKPPTFRFQRSGVSSRVGSRGGIFEASLFVTDSERSVEFPTVDVDQFLSEFARAILYLAMGENEQDVTDSGAVLIRLVRAESDTILYEIPEFGDGSLTWHQLTGALKYLAESVRELEHFDEFSDGLDRVVFNVVAQF